MSSAIQPGLHAAAPSIAPGPGHGLRNSTRTHIVLLRFGMTSLSTAIIDNLVFYLVFRSVGSIAAAQIAGRAASVFFNYSFVRRSVFRSDRGHQILLPRYLMLVVVNALISYTGIRLLAAFTALSVMLSKMLIETLLFFANFMVQRALIFTRRPGVPGLPGAGPAGL